MFRVDHVDIPKLYGATLTVEYCIYKGTPERCERRRGGGGGGHDMTIERGVACHFSV